METKREDIRQAGTEYLKGDLFGWQNFSACYRIFEAGVLWSEGRLSTREKNSKAQEESLRIERLECDQRGLKLASLEQENKELKEGHAGMLREHASMLKQRNDMYEDREAKNIECLNLTKQLAEQAHGIERLKERVRAAMDERNVVRREVITQHGEIERLRKSEAEWISKYGEAAREASHNKLNCEGYVIQIKHMQEHIDKLVEEDATKDRELSELREQVKGSTQVIPQWIIDYDKAGHQSSAGKAIRALLEINKNTHLLLSDTTRRSVENGTRERENVRVLREALEKIELSLCDEGSIPDYQRIGLLSIAETALSTLSEDKQD